MSSASRFSVVIASGAARRTAYLIDELARLAARGGVTVVGATREAADELVRAVARGRPATFGMSRFSLPQLAIRIAGPALAARGIAPSTPLGFEAVAARAVFDLQEARALRAFADAADTPGFPRAVARTSADLRARRVSPADVAGIAAPGADDLALVHAHIEAELASAGAADPETLFSAAAAAVAGEPWLRAPLVLLDVWWRSAAEAEFIAALVARASSTTGHLPPVRPRHRGGRSRRSAACRWCSTSRRPPTWIICGCTSSPRSPSRCARPTAAWSSSRRRARAASAWRSRGASCARPRAASPSTTWPSSCGPRATTRACSNMPSNAPACRRGSTRAPGGRIP